jgi:Leucine-rich repeat (LRR) protein
MITIKYDLDGEEIQKETFDEIDNYDDVISLNCSHNKLDKLPTLPCKLQNLFCFDNELTNLPELPDTLQILACYDNQLIDLLPSKAGSSESKDSCFKLPSTLKHLGCAGNKLTQLPEMPETLLTFSCNRNQLTILPKFPDTLQELGCSFNNLDIFCSSKNQLVGSEYPLPSGLTVFYCWGNPELTYTEEWLNENPKYADHVKQHGKLYGSSTEVPQQNNVNINDFSNLMKCLGKMTSLFNKDEASKDDVLEPLEELVGIMKSSDNLVKACRE